MKTSYTTYLAALLVFFCTRTLLAQKQQAPFASEIQAFKKEDSLAFPPANAILFTGSSSIRLWKNIDSSFPGYTIINRGFGGSTLPDVIRYADQVIFPYKPKQVIIYCGDNDLASSDTVTAQTVFRRFRQLFKQIRTRMPGVDIAYISIKPSPSRAHLIPKVNQANTLIKAYLQKQKRAHFINVYSAMLDRNGKPKEALFLEDRLHMRPEGYALWQRLIRPYLLK
jgi:lysophospholipase L1-like esterase